MSNKTAFFLSEVGVGVCRAFVGNNVVSAVVVSFSQSVVGWFCDELQSDGKAGIEDVSIVIDEDEKVLDDVEEAEDAVDGGGVSSTTINCSLSSGDLLGFALSSPFSYVPLFASRNNIFLGFNSFFGECLELCALADEKWLITSMESVVVSIENEIDSDESMMMG